MKLQILKQEGNYVKLRIEDEPYTLYNLLRHVLAEREDVKMVGFAKVETFADVIEFQLELVEDSEEDPIALMGSAAKEIMTMTDEFVSAINDVLS